MKKFKVCVDNVIYDSMTDAAKAIGAFQQNLGKALSKGNGQCIYRNHKITKMEATYGNNPFKSKSIINKINNKNFKPRSCPVTCITTNERFDSIQAVANKLKLNAWTIGLKMDKAGKFIDDNGNEYIREVPIQSRKNGVSYPIQKPFMLREHISHTSNKEIISKVNITKSIPVKTNISKADTLDTLNTLANNLTKANMYKEASYIYEALAQLTK